MLSEYVRWMPAQAVALLIGCVLQPVDPSTRLCPCAPGWRCTASLRCEPCGDDAIDCDPNRPDAGLDAGRRDAGANDAGALDAGVFDGAVIDGGEPTDGDVPMDAPFGDAGSDDASIPPDGGPPSFCDEAEPGRLFCDGFESLFGGWTLRQGDVTILTDDVFRGFRAARATQPTDVASTASHNVVRSGIIPSSASRFFVRFWIRRRSGYGPRSNPFNVLVVRSDDGTFRINWRLDPSERTLVQVIRPGGSDTSPTSTTSIALDEWTCLALGVERGSPGRVVATITDPTTGAASEVAVDALVGTQHSVLSVGAMLIRDAASIDIDEVALGTEPLPCP